MDRMLSCECGNKIAVSSSQAGRQIHCSFCNAVLQVPTLRGLAELPPLVAEDSAVPMATRSGETASTWRWRGPAMAVCAAVLLVTLASAGYFLRNWAQVDRSRDVEAHVAVMNKVFDKADPSELGQIWDEYSSLSLQKPEPPIYKLLNDWAARNLNYGLIAVGFSIASLAGILMLWRSASSAKRMPRGGPT